MGTVTLGGEIPIRLRPNAQLERLMHNAAPQLELAGFEITELSERQLTFEAGYRARDERRCQFLESGSLVALPRSRGWAVRYHFVAKTPPWLLLAFGAGVIAAMMWRAGGKFTFQVGLPLPAISFAALGNRAAMRAEVRALLVEILEFVPGVDC